MSVFHVKSCLQKKIDHEITIVEFSQEKHFYLLNKEKDSKIFIQAFKTDFCIQ